MIEAQPAPGKIVHRFLRHTSVPARDLGDIASDALSILAVTEDGAIRHLADHIIQIISFHELPEWQELMGVGRLVLPRPNDVYDPEQP